RFHGCGHDGHTTTLLYAAEYLARTRQFTGTLQLIFQPAEELLYGGRVMVEDGLFDQFPCDAIFGLHNMPGARQIFSCVEQRGGVPVMAAAVKA
ncbi:M20/M25/M40 family metallo-hydrolase, partial [Klebsiella pneumoniae]